jgi:hypothetical protein
MPWGDFFTVLFVFFMFYFCEQEYESDITQLKNAKVRALFWTLSLRRPTSLPAFPVLFSAKAPLRL